MKWKPLKLEGPFLVNAAEQGLIGIEECTDYDTNNIISGKRKKRKKNSKLESESNKKAKTTAITEREVKLADELLSPSKSGCSEWIEESLVAKTTRQDETPNLKAWEGYSLPSSILKALNDLKFEQPTEIQAFTLPSAILGKRDILGAAETGSGKTLAFGLPMLTGILWLKENESQKEANFENVDSDDEDDNSDLDLDENGIGFVRSYKIEKEYKTRKPLYGLIITPTRELAMQVRNHLISVAKYTGINIAVVVGGMAAVKQERILSKGPEIVVGTPGRLWELIQQGNEHLNQINNIKFLAIDETDRMLERGHFKELQDLLERINLDEENKKQRQNFVFSATLTLIHAIPKHLVNRSKLKGRKLYDMSPEQKLQKIINMLGITDPKIVDLSQGTGTSGTLTECRITCAIDEKDYYVYYFLLKYPGRTLIFCNSIGCVKRLTTLLTLLDCNPLPLHASMQQRQRLKNLERFRDTENSILIATDVAARGLDIPKIEHVLHYQTPRTSESYVHRSGRTARASKQGITVLIMEPTEFTSYIKLCKTLGKNEDLPLFPVHEKYLNAVKERVNIARDLDKLQLRVRKANSEEGWLQKAAEEMDIILDMVSQKYDKDETSSSKRLADLKRKQLLSLLATPVFPQGFSAKFPLYETFTSTVATNLEERAIDTMKNSLEANSKQKRKPIPLYKPKNKDEKKTSRNVIIKLNKFNIANKGNNKQFKKRKAVKTLLKKCFD